MKVHRIWLVLFALVVACDGDRRQQEVRLTVSQAMGSVVDAGFARALRPRPLNFPEDHGAHPAFATEWWYLTGNLRADNGRRFGYQFTLFRVGLRAGEPPSDSTWRAHQIYMGHIAVSDIDGGAHHSAERFARAALGLSGARSSPFAVWLGPWSLRGSAALFPLTLSADNTDIGLSLQLQAGSKPLVLQGEDGLSRKSARPGNASYYYSFTRLPTSGELRIGDSRYRVTGNSWLDREWSSSALDEDQTGWDWFALQLQDGRDLMFYQLRDTQGRPHPFSRGKLVLPDGSAQVLLPDDVTLSPLRYWAADDGARYPVAWRMQVAEQGLDLEVRALLDDQLMDHSIRYWEGAVAVSGSHRGTGYLELSGYDQAAPDRRLP
jgi:predicted secreted hydrolase